MPPDRLRSIVPMFGGGDQYVETLDIIVDYVEANRPSTDELVGWHRGTFEAVSSRESIMRRVDYLEDVGLLEAADDGWDLGPLGREYTEDRATSTLLRIMCDRNVGLRSLLYALSTGPMTIEEISDQQLDTHPELGWSRGQTDMATQRANWLRSMALVEKTDQTYELTIDGWEFVDDAVEAWANPDRPPVEDADDWTTGTYETVTVARSMDPEFRSTVLSRFNRRCPVSGVDHADLLDVAHILPWGDFPDYRGDPSNVWALSKLHHAAFDRDLFTVDRDYRIRSNPSFETQCDFLEETIIDRSGERIHSLHERLDPEYLHRRNAGLEWLD